MCEIRSLPQTETRSRIALEKQVVHVLIRVRYVSDVCGIRLIVPGGAAALCSLCRMLGPRSPGACRTLQGYFAHEKQAPSPRTTILLHPSDHEAQGLIYVSRVLHTYISYNLVIYVLCALTYFRYMSDTF